MIQPQERDQTQEPGKMHAAFSRIKERILRPYDTRSEKIGRAVAAVGLAIALHQGVELVTDVKDAVTDHIRAEGLSQFADSQSAQGLFGPAANAHGASADAYGATAEHSEDALHHTVGIGVGLTIAGMSVAIPPMIDDLSRRRRV